MTEFYLATTSNEYKACHEILDKLGRTDRVPLSFPTIIGKRDGRVVCFISTRNLKKAKAVVVGELGIDPSIKRAQFILYKLVETYEAFLVTHGIVSYLACVPLKMDHYIKVIKLAMDLDPYTQDSEVAWFHRRIA